MSLYTVEQLELIRRLKATGITVQAIVDAFNEMNSVSNQLDSINYQQCPGAATTAEPESPVVTTVPSSPPSTSFVPLVPVSVPVPAPLVPTTPVPVVPVSIETTLASLMPSPSTISNSMFLALQGAPIPQMPPSSVLHNSFAAAVAQHAALQQAAAAEVAAALQHQQQQQQTPPPSVSASTSSEPSSTMPRPPRTSQRTPMREITTLDNPQELEEFMTQGEEGCIQAMKTFITHYSLRQTTVAMMTGVSQPYISKLLNGNHRELSLRCRKNIYCWYLNCRKHPEKLSSFLADPASRLETNGDGELVPQKRERYVFRPVLLRLLEDFFNETPFPDTARRQEIANACNNALVADKKGMVLMPKEVVSSQVVSNWFANKRKELRRKNDPRYQDSTIAGLHPALVEALERGSGSVPAASDNGSASPTADEDTMDGMEMVQASLPRPTLPPPDFSIFERLGLAAPQGLFGHIKSEAVENQF